MKKIIFFSKNLNIGGMEKSLVELLNHLVNQYEVTLVLEEECGTLLSLIDSKVKIKEYKLFNFKNVFLRKTMNLFKRLLWSIINYNKYDFSCNYAIYSFCGSRLGKIASKNNALYIHSDYYNVFNKNIGEFKNFFQNHKFKKFKHLIFVSNECRDNFLKVYPDLSNKLVVINNLIDYNSVKKLSLEEINIKIDSKKTNFAFIGRLDNSSKNLDLLLSCFCDAIKKNKEIMLYIIGNGSYKNNMVNFIKKHNLIRNIILIEETNNPYAYLSRCDALVLTSNYEGFPVVYLEALVLNKQIITTVPTSDANIDIRKHCIVIKKDKNDIVDKLLNFSKENKISNINFEKVNRNNLGNIRKIIEVK